MEKKICFFDRHYKKDSEGFGSGAMRTSQIYDALIKKKYNSFLLTFCNIFASLRQLPDPD